jgi:hypothetical protein
MCSSLHRTPSLRPTATHVGALSRHGPGTRPSTAGCSRRTIAQRLSERSVMHMLKSDPDTRRPVSPKGSGRKHNRGELMRVAVLCLIASFAAAAPIVGCSSSTTVAETWKAPGTTKLTFKKILVIAASPSETFRHQAEDLMAREIKGAQVLKSYTLLPDRESLEDKANVDKIVADHAIDGIVMMRVVSNKTEVDYIPPSYPSSYYSFGSYYGPHYGLAPYYYEQGDIRTTEIIGVETNIYDAKDGKLVWSGLTKTRDPDDTNELLKETVDAVHGELKDEKLVP